jgi:hypothetical protein
MSNLLFRRYCRCPETLGSRGLLVSGLQLPLMIYATATCGSDTPSNSAFSAASSTVTAFRTASQTRGELFLQSNHSETTDPVISRSLAITAIAPLCRRRTFLYGALPALVVGCLFVEVLAITR